jgi:hypothetical protein
MIETKFIDHTSKKWMWTHLNTEEEVNEVCDYLKVDNLTIKIESDRNLYNVYLDKINLSINGYCFTGNNLIAHVRYFRKFQDISKTEDYLEWIGKFEKYNIVRKYLNERRLPDIMEIDLVFNK